MEQPEKITTSVRISVDTLEGIKRVSMPGEKRSQAINRLLDLAITSIEEDGGEDIGAVIENEALRADVKRLEAAGKAATELAEERKLRIDDLNDMIETLKGELVAKNKQIEAAQVSTAMVIAGNKPKLLDRFKAFFSGKQSDE